MSRLDIRRCIARTSCIQFTYFFTRWVMCILSNVYPEFMFIPDLRRRGSLWYEAHCVRWDVRGVRVSVREIGMIGGCQGKRTSPAKRSTSIQSTHIYCVHPLWCCGEIREGLGALIGVCIVYKCIVYKGRSE